MNKIFFTFLIIISCLVNSYFAGAQEIAARVNVAKDTFIIGDKIEVEVTIQLPDGHSFKLEKIPQLNNVEWLDSTQLTQTYTSPSQIFFITGFDSGQFTFPSLNFNILNEESAVVAKASTQRFPVNITFAIVDTTKDIKPIIAPLEVDYQPFPRWLIILVILILLAILYFLFRRWQKKRKDKISAKPEEIIHSPSNKISIEEETLEQINQLQEKYKGRNEQQFWFELKEILRNFINKKYRIKTAEKTSEEIIFKLKKEHNSLGQSVILKDIFAKADMVLFANETFLEEEKEIFAHRSVEFIQSTKAKMEDNFPAEK